MRINGVFSDSNPTSAGSLHHKRLDRIFEQSQEKIANLKHQDQKGIGTEQGEQQTEILIDAVEEINETLEIYGRRFEISVHERTNAVMVKVIDTNTDEIIREIPPEKILDMVAALWEIAGIIIDEKI